MVGRAHDGGGARAEQPAGRARAEVSPYVETVSGVLEDAGHRGSAAWAALRDPAGDVLPTRRWPWAFGAAVAGAAAGAVVALAIGRVRTADVPGAQDPEELQAVVDRPEGTTPA